MEDCIPAGRDVTRGGAKHNYSGIQAIQVANIADSAAVLQKLVFGKRSISKKALLEALRNNFKGFANLRYTCMNDVPKYGNDDPWMDELGNRWVAYFNKQIRKHKNYRGGEYHLGLYTVFTHVRP